MPKAKKVVAKAVKSVRKPAKSPIEKVRDGLLAIERAIDVASTRLSKYGIDISLKDVAECAVDAVNALDGMVAGGLTITPQRGRKDRLFSVGDPVVVDGIHGKVLEVIGEGANQKIKVEYDDGEKVLVQRRLVKKVK